MKRASLSILSVCGLEELEGHRESGITHVLSILDPGTPDPISFSRYDNHHRTTLRFHDIIEPQPGLILPEREHVEQIVAFGEELVDDLGEGRDGHLLIHCHMGISRSTAAMMTLMAQADAAEDEDVLFARLREIRPQAWPNSVMIGFADAQLGRDGRLTQALRRHYAHQIEAQPQFRTWMNDLGRKREIEMGLGL